MMIKAFKTVATLALTVAVAGCSCEGGKNTKKEVISKQNVEQNVREFVYPLPTAFEVTEMLNRIDAAYIQTICNSSTNAVKYLTRDKRALNLGIYSADMCYASTYNQQQTVLEYMDVVKKLIDELDMTSAVDPELPNKIESNENNKEELTRLITESFYDSYDYLNKNDRGPVSLLIVAGSWIEGLYITTHISEDTFNNKEMVKIVLSQKEPLKKLMELLDKYTGDQTVDPIKTELTPLFNIYSGIEEGGISEQQITDITNTVDKIRNTIITA